MALAQTTIEHLFSVLTRSDGPDAIILTGAGASLKSGIPLGSGVVEKAARWAYCRRNGRDLDDPTVSRSDWLKWLQAHDWYRPDVAMADNYCAVVEHLLQPQQERKEFFLRILDPGVPPSLGYEQLRDFLANDVVKTVLTTNFDAVLPDCCRASHRPHHLEVIKTPADYTKFSTHPKFPQLVYTHGSVEHYSDKNLLTEVQKLDEQLVKMLVPVLRDHPIIVVGYRGAEPSIMRHLLLDQLDGANRFRHGIYWCAMRANVPDGLHPLVHELGEALGPNFNLVPIDGFDEMMNELWGMYERKKKETGTPAARAQAGTDSPSFEFKVVTDSKVDQLDWRRVEQQLSN